MTAVANIPAPRKASPGEAAPLLSVRNLSVRFFTHAGTVDAVTDVSFDLQPGERLAIVGESGSGKSVMTMSLMRLVGHPGRITGGSVILKETDLLSLSEKQLNRMRGNRIAMVFQDPMTSLNPVLRVDEQLAAPMVRHLGLSQSEARSRVVELLRQVGIPAAEARAHDYPHELSGGMRQRVLIAMAMSCRPDLLLADEPTTALDVTIQAQIMELLKDISAQTGSAVIFVTHDLGLVARFAQSVAVMYAGRIVEHGPVESIFRDPQHPYTQGLLRSIPAIDGSRTEKLVQIPGFPPDLKRLGEGCAFEPRCPVATAVCSSEQPPSTPRGPGHVAACWVSGWKSEATA